MNRVDRRSKTAEPEVVLLGKPWTPKELSEFLGLTIATLAQMRYTGTGPKYLKIGHQIRYQPYDVQEWLTTRTRTSTSAGSGVPR